MSVVFGMMHPQFSPPPTARERPDTIAAKKESLTTAVASLKQLMVLNKFDYYGSLPYQQVPEDMRVRLNEFYQYMLDAHYELGRIEYIEKHGFEKCFPDEPSFVSPEVIK